MNSLLEHPSNVNMLHYTIGFVKTIDGKEGEGHEERLYWRCWADDYDHAVEQLKDEVEHGEGERVLFHELIETSK